LKKLLASWLLVFSGVLYASSIDRGTFKSSYSSHDVELDTNPQSAFWRGASTTYVEADSLGHVLPAYRTRVHSRWTKDNLYLLFECPYEELYLKPAPNAVEETNELWDWDVAELFIGSDFQNIRHYKEFEVSPQKEWIDLDINLDLPDHTVGWKWNSGFKVDAHIDASAKVWYAAMRIPFVAIDTRPPVAGRTFRANLFRSQGPPDHRVSMAWRAPMSDSFHVPEKFGILKLIR
jgi:hypothetical protein